MSDILDLLGIKGPSPDPSPATPPPGIPASKPKAKAPKPEAAKPKAVGPAGTEDDAAHALAAALDADTGRRKSLAHWKPVVGTALGINRLYKKRYDAVLDKGVELGLFTVDRDTGSYPFLIRIVPVPEEPEDPDVIASREERERAKAQLKQAPPPPKEPPKDWKPPGYLDCGHMEWATAEQDEAAQTDGKCCANRSPINWRFVRGKYRRPVPPGRRRTPERERGQGFPGLCCDKKGFYIGGKFNDCMKAGKRKQCSYHGRKRD